MRIGKDCIRGECSNYPCDTKKCNRQLGWDNNGKWKLFEPIEARKVRNGIKRLIDNERMRFNSLQDV